MKLYLVRHGKAERAGATDWARALSERGEQDARNVAALAARLKVEVDQIHHSGLVRAEQTAAIFAEKLAPPQGVVEVTEMTPMDDVAHTAQELARLSRPVMLVGHLPHLERLAALLVTGDPNGSVVQLRTGSMLCLEPDDARWRVSWLVTPRMVRE